MLNNLEFQEYSIRNYIVQRFCRPDYYNQNTYILTDCIYQSQYIIDPGDGYENLKEKIIANKFPLEAIILTHGHFDHAGAAASLSDFFSVPVYIHTDDIRLLKRASTYAFIFNKTVFRVPDNIQLFGNKMFENMSIIPTPGHTQGSVCFLFPDFMFSGDTILNGEYGRTDLPGGNAEQLKKSVNLLLEKMDKEILIFPGHDSPFQLKEFIKM